MGGGKTYGVINGKFSDKVIRRVNGRDQFANVLTKLPPERYNTSYIFRAYAVMEKDGSSVVIYGPEMSRSMYTVCKQILNRGDFKPGTSGRLPETSEGHTGPGTGRKTECNTSGELFQCSTSGTAE